MSKCFGCGGTLDYDEVIDDSKEVSHQQLCSRCFKMKNYGEYAPSTDVIDYTNILEKINKSNSLVVYVADIMDLNEEIISDKIKVDLPIILVLSKQDLLPKSVKETKIIERIKKYNLNIIDVVLVSSMTNYNLDYLYNVLLKKSVYNDIYIVGSANAGKSTLINKLIKNYSNNDSFITTSMMPGATIDLIKINLNDNICLIDTPGLIEEDSLLNQVSVAELKHLLPKKEVRPKTFQIKPNQAILIDNYLRLDYFDNIQNSMTAYLSNNLKVKSINALKNKTLKNDKPICLTVEENTDIIIKGLGFIKVVKPCQVTIYTPYNLKITTRQKLI